MKTITSLSQPLPLFLTFFLFVQTGISQVGIATTTPAYQFEMVNTGIVGATAMAQFTNNDDEGVALSSFNTDITIGYNAFEGVTNYLGTAFSPAGVFGLAINQGPAQAPTVGVRGHTNEWQGTGVEGSRFNSGGPDSGFGGVFFSDLGYTGGLFNISDRRTKSNINGISNALSTIGQLNPVSYYYDLDKYPDMGLNNKLEYGFIAQEVKDVLPEITKEKTLKIDRAKAVLPHETTTYQSESFLMMDYSRIIPIITKGIQEQQEIIEDQNQRILALEKEVKVLQQKLNAILERIDN